MKSDEKKYILLASICGTFGGLVSGLAGSRYIWINMIVGGMISLLLSYFLKDIFFKK